MINNNNQEKTRRVEGSTPAINNYITNSNPAPLTSYYANTKNYPSPSAQIEMLRNSERSQNSVSLGDTYSQVRSINADLKKEEEANEDDIGMISKWMICVGLGGAISSDTAMKQHRNAKAKGVLKLNELLLKTEADQEVAYKALNEACLLKAEIEETLKPMANMKADGNEFFNETLFNTKLLQLNDKIQKEKLAMFRYEVKAAEVQRIHKALLLLNKGSEVGDEIESLLSDLSLGLQGIDYASLGAHKRNRVARVINGLEADREGSSIINETLDDVDEPTFEATGSSAIKRLGDNLVRSVLDSRRQSELYYLPQAPRNDPSNKPPPPSNDNPPQSPPPLIPAVVNVVDPIAVVVSPAEPSQPPAVDSSDQSPNLVP